MSSLSCNSFAAASVNPLTPARWPSTLDEEDKESAAGYDLTACDRDAAVAWAAARWRKHKDHLAPKKQCRVW